MKKFYLLILTVVFLFCSFAGQAQIYTSITDNSLTNYTLDDGRFWQGGVAPTNPCTGCTITINTDVTMVSSRQTSSDATDNGSLDLNSVVLNGCTLTINGGVILTVDTYLQLFNSSVLVGSDATTAATVFVNDQVDLNGTSTVQLANQSCLVDANGNLPGPLPILGPRTVAGNSIPGIFFVRAPGVYDWTLDKLAMANSAQTYFFQKYNINCATPAAPPLPACAIGLVYGPAKISYDAINDFWGFGQVATLPVELVQFVAIKNGDGSIKLSWATAQEVNSASFDIERSADQGSWEKIGSVKAKGYSSITANYTYTDQFPLAGNGYYRLKMIDLDGKYQYSKVVVVSSDNNSQPLVIYSNPFSDQIRLKVNVSRAQNLTLTVSDIIGKTYLKQSYNAAAGDNLINLVPAGASSGMYVLHIQGTTYDQTVKLVKQ